MMRTACLLLVVLVACNGDPIIEPDPNPPTGIEPRIALVTVATGLASPVWLTAPRDDDRLFVLEQEGRIRIIRNDTLIPTPFLDITDRVLLGSERGLLGLAFHPDYATNGRFFVHHTNNAGNTVVAEYRVTANPDVADPASGTTLLTVNQPFPNHNGGQVSFGPDGYLYIGLGDGGSAGDPQGHGQNPNTLLGTILRIDVDAGGAYGIPADNPFADGVAGAPEVWAYGLRNPWRFSHDSPSGILIVADVGQNTLEEINIVPADSGGLNFGWNVMEGSQCYAAASCNAQGLTMPYQVYQHGSGSNRGCSITGGAVYRGLGIPELQGFYLYGDYCGGWVRGLWTGTAIANIQTDFELVVPGLGAITSFGTDADGEMYVLTQDGTVRRVVAPITP